MTRNEFEKVTAYVNAVTSRLEMVRKQVRDRNYGLAEFTLAKELPPLTLKVDDET